MPFRPQLRSESLGVSPGFHFLAFEHGMVVRGGVTVLESTVGVDADGEKLLLAGTVMAEITASGKFAAYDDALSDGREDAVGFLVEEINVKDGDVITSILLHGSVIEARTSGADAAAKTDFGGAIIFQ